MGCYLIEIFYPWTVSLDDVFELSTVQCVEWCRGENHSYAGLHNSTCHCAANAPPPHTVVEGTLCNITCGGNDMQHCGGVRSPLLYMSVYEVGK